MGNYGSTGPIIDAQVFQMFWYGVSSHITIPPNAWTRTVFYSISQTSFPTLVCRRYQDAQSGVCHGNEDSSSGSRKTTEPNIGDCTTIDMCWDPILHHRPRVVHGSEYFGQMNRLDPPEG